MSTLDLFDLPDGADQESKPAEMAETSADELGGGTPTGDVERPSTRPRKVWRVSQINRAVRLLLEDTLPSLWLAGEVSGWTRARSGHRYFALKDEAAQLRCVMFRSDAERLPLDPDDGMQVRAFGALTLYEARGEYQLVVRRLTTEEGEGLWRIAMERLRAKLQSEGLLAPERKRPVPRYPRAIGVVTSTSGAALRDILTGIARRAPWSHVVVRGARVQGEGAARDVAAALRALGRSGLVDVVIVGRGGGSAEDLWAFNEEPVARAIAECPVPVICAVGHDVDVTIADLVADVRAPTPTAAAALAVADGAALARGLQATRGRLARALVSAVNGRRAQIAQLRMRTERATDRLIAGRRDRVAALAGRLHALSPLATLDRGFSLAMSPDGAILRRAGDFSVGQRFDLRLADGTVSASTLGVERHRESDA